MDKKKREYFKTRLLEERKKTIELIEDIEKRQEESEDKTDSRLSTYPNHPADEGTEVYMRSQDQGFIENLEKTLNEIDQSLEDIEKDRYGYCNNCEKMISEERLEIIPYAKTCLGCSGTEDDVISEYETVEDEKRANSNEDGGYNRNDVYVDLMEDNIVPNDPSYSTGDNMGIEDEREDFEITEEIEDMYYEIDELGDKKELDKKKDLEDEDLL